jgi:selenide,water dikinase
VILEPAVRIDATTKRIHLAARPPIRYDLAAVDIGSTVAGLELPGVREHALPTRPVGRLVGRVEEVSATARKSGVGSFRVVVVGGGAAGVELAFTFRERLRRERPDVQVTLVEASPRLLPGYPASLARRIEAALARRGIKVVTGCKVASVERSAVCLADGSSLSCEALIWVAGAVSHPLFRESGLPTDSRGFVLTRPSLQVVGRDDLFATGDCATLEDFPQTAKAGVYAVRQGPYLIRNLRAALAGEPLTRYRPQRDFLTLLNLGDGEAVGSKWGVSFEGRWVMRWKDWIDRRFMHRFQMLEPDGAPGPAIEQMPEMPEMEAVCGGCAAKLGQDVLERALARLDPAPAAPEVVLGMAEADDIAAVQLPEGDVLAMSVDSFRAFTDDPFLVGRVAAVNAVSDLDAKGVAPRWAMAQVALPLAAADREAEEILVQVLAGARAAFDPLGVRLLGGHTSKATELQVGFSVQGLGRAGAPLLRRRGPLAAGQVLILTRPLGTGVLFHADMAGRARGPWLEAALASMLAGNGPAADVARQVGAVAATDVTGFGLAGHLASMLAGSGLSVRLDLAALPALPGAIELLARGERSTFHPENARLRRVLAIAPDAAGDPRLELLFDPQTAGGLLFAAAREIADEALVLLRGAGYATPAVVGKISAGRADGAVAEVVVSRPRPPAGPAST